NELVEQNQSRNALNDKKGRKNSNERKQGRLVSYVFSGKQTEQERREQQESEKTSSVARAGVAHVLVYEKANDRFPIEMPINHPGYDIESKDAVGEVARYIEVKSLGGKWGTLGVGLTETEFEKALSLGDRYWLYVVEDAESDDFVIYSIQNPACQVTDFRYDYGWRALAEENFT